MQNRILGLLTADVRSEAAAGSDAMDGGHIISGGIRLVDNTDGGTQLQIIV